MNRCLLFILFSFFTASSLAQIQLQGQVFSNDSITIEYASVWLQNTANPNLSAGTITDQEGRFKLAVPQTGNYQLQIRFLGFEDWQQELNIQESLDLGKITLASSTNLLEGVTVTGNRPIIERVEDKLVFNVASSPLNAGYDGMEVLQRSPNIWVSPDGSILMRNEAAKIMINGRILNWSSEDISNYLSNLNSEDIQSIQIQTNLGANVDAESSGGVINIILKKKRLGLRGNFRNYLTYRGSSYYSAYSSLNFDYGAEKWNVYGNYNYTFHNSEVLSNTSIDYFQDQLLLSTFQDRQDTMKLSRFRLGAVVEPADNHVLGVEVFGLNRQRIFDEENYVRFTESNGVLDEGLTLFRDDIFTDSYNATFNYKWTIDTLNSKLQFFADYALQQNERDNLSESSYDFGVFPPITERNRSNAQTEVYSMQLDLEKYFLSKTKLETGGKYTLTKRNNSLLSEYFETSEWIANDRTTAFNYNEQIAAAYAAVSQPIGEHYFAKAGIRVENTTLERLDLIEEDVVEQNYWTWVPNAYISRNFKNKTSLALSYAQRISRPSFTLLNNNIRKVNDFRFELGNPDLQPEYVHRFELSYNQKKQTIATYYNLTTDAINGIYFLEDQVAFYKKFNEGKQEQYGIEYNRFGNLTKWWYIRASAHLYRRKYINEAGEDSFEQNSARLRLFNNFKINSTTSIDLSGYYNSPTADAFFIAEEFYAVDFMLQKFFFDKKLHCRIYVNDIFNTLVYANGRPFQNFRTTASSKPRTQRITFWMTYNFSNQQRVNGRKAESKNEVRRRL
ncbi:MAG: outer membrane beta-barrel family protein [Bacteroidota bacterium]